MHTKKMVAMCFCAVVALFGAAAEAGVFCPTQCKIKTVPFENKIWFMIDMPESVRMDLYVGKSIDANGNILSPTVFNGGHEGRDWNVAVQNVELDTLYYYKLQVTNQGGNKSSKYGAVWSNQVNLRLVWSHLDVIDNGEDMYSGAGELDVHVIKDNKNGVPLFNFGDYSSWAVKGGTYNVNKQQVIKDIKTDSVTLFAWANETDIGSAVPGGSYVETTYVLPLSGAGWSSNGERDFSIQIQNTQKKIDLKLHFKGYRAYAITNDKPVPNMSHLDSKPPVLAGSEDPQALRRITVKSPNGGEKWTAGQTKTITWTALGVPVMIVLRKGDVPVQVLSPNEAPAMQGSFTWHIPWNVPPGDDYKIRVRNMDNSMRDDSDGPFSITKIALKPGLPKP